MVSVWIRHGDGQASAAKVDDLAAAIRQDKAVIWVDMENASDADYAILKDIFQFHPLAIEDAIKTAERPKIESYTHTGDCAGKPYYYMVIHGPDLDTYKQKLRTKELDIFFSERYLVTIHDEKFRAVDEVKTRVQADPGRALGEGTDVLLYNILDRLIDAYEPILDNLGDELDDLEESALERPGPELLQQIAIRKRELLNMRRLAGPQREVIAQLARGEIPAIRESTRLYFRDIQDHVNRHVEMIEVYRDLVQGARDLYLSSISNHLNQIMKTLTLFSVVALPMTVITGFFGMNFEAIPGLHSKTGFWLAVAVMGAIEVGLIWLFRKRGWI